MKPLIYLAILIFTIQEGMAQDSVRVNREFRNNKPESRTDSIFNSIPNIIFISFDEGFNDTLYVTVNDEVVFNGYLKTNESIGLAGGIQINFKDSSEIKKLKLKFVNANLFFHEKVNLSYKSLQIRKLDIGLSLIYTNQFPWRE